MLGAGDIWKRYHHLKILEEDVAKTVKAQRRNVQRAVVLEGVARLRIRPASTRL